MICFGVCVGPTDDFERLAEPALRALDVDRSSILLRRGSTSIASSYNSIIDEALLNPDVSALVLLHDDVVIKDRNFYARIERCLRDDAVGVVGVVGAQNLRDMKYWGGSPRFGRVWDGAGYQHFGPSRAEVDSVDGLLMVLSRTAMERVRFDETLVTGFHGYDADYCLSCRDVGLRVLVEPFWIFHESPGDAGGAFVSTEHRFMEKWGHRLARPTLADRSPRFRAVSARVKRLGAAFEPGVEEVSQLVRSGANRIRRSSTSHPRPTSEVTRYADEIAPPPECPICGSDQIIDHRATVPLVECEVCGVGVTWPPPAVDVTSEDIFIHSYEDSRNAKRSRWFHEARLRVEWLKLWKPEGLVLEVGSATGEFVQTATAEGYEAYGVEPSVWAAQQARDRGADVFSGTLEEWAEEFRGFTVDAVVMFHVLEHVPDPIGLLRFCRPLLDDRGIVMIEVPNFGSRDARLREPSWTGWAFDFHAFHYTVATLHLILESAGFEAVEMMEFSGRSYTAHLNWEARRAADRINGFDMPDKHLIRIVARRSGAAR